MRRIGFRRVIVVLAVLICAALVWFNFFRAKMIGEFFASMKMPAVTVSATTTERTTWKPEIRAIGTLAAVQGADISSQLAGVVQSIDFKANDRVDQGQLLVQIDDAIERADLMSGQAALERDKAAMARAETLRKTGVNSAANLQDMESTLASSRSALAKIQAVLDQKAIEAPFAGTVGIPRVDVGEYVQPGTVIATLQRLDTMRVDFTVPEQLLGEIRMGQAATFGLTEESFPYQGEIVGIDPKIDSKTRLVAVRAEVKNSDGNLRPGQFARVRVELPADEDVIALPQTAVVTSLYGDYVYVVAPAGSAPSAAPAEGDAALRQSLPAEGKAMPSPDTQTKQPAAPPTETAEEPAAAANAATAPSAGDQLVAMQVFVETGRRKGNLIEIAKGLDAGQRVVTSGQNKLSNNAPVTINNDIDPAKIAQEGGDGAS
jgi:membrane fusion protein (multidrug efflux system)